MTTADLPDTEAGEPVRVVCGDGLALLRALPDGAVDHVITDPPYSERTHAGARTNRAASGVSKLIGFASFADDQFVETCRLCCRAARRWVLLTCDWRHAALLETALPDEFVRLGVWVKPNGMPQVTGDRPGTGWEAVALLHRKGRKRWNGGGHHAVWTCPKPADVIHPTQKPVPLVREWVRSFTDPGELVLDPFCGSGTVPLSCWYEGRRAVGVEIDPQYAGSALARVRAVVGAERLFPYAPPPPRVRDERLF